jgi:hypothetical protein
MLRRLWLLITFAVALVITTAFTSSCFDLTYANDPTADTPGYRLFTGKSEDLRFSFEYPDEWRRVVRGIIGLSRSVYLIPYDYFYSRVIVRSETTSANDGDFADAGELIEQILDVPSESPEFKILSHGVASLGQAEGEEVIYSFRPQREPYYLLPEFLYDQLVVTRDLVADYGNRIYYVSLVVDADQYESFRKGFEHLIATFYFLE